MIDIKKKTQCSGCSACVEKCPKKCISLHADSEGFLYPEINTTECIDCGLCEKTCHILNPYEPNIPIETLAVKNNNEETRAKSSSGGFFTAIAKRIINENCIVFGVKFDSGWMPVFSYTENIAGLENFRGSKYVQARIEDSYSRCRDFLKQGRKVLFCGTPCQVSALYHFLGKRYDNLLITIDFVCHGVPSPGIWSDYLRHITGNSLLSSIKSVNFRDKSRSWFFFQISIDASNLTINRLAWSDPYMRAFLSDYSLRPSCYDCQARSGRSTSDITMGDCWGIDEMAPDFSDDKGVSLLLINTPKGKDLINGLDLSIRSLSFDEVVKHNRSITSNPETPKKRHKFFRLLNEGKTLEEANNIVHAVSIYERILWSVRRRLHLQ